MQVYKARWHGTLVAVKVLKSEDPDEAEAFSHETSILENLHHLHVVAYYDAIITADGTVSPLWEVPRRCFWPFTACRGCEQASGPHHASSRLSAGMLLPGVASTSAHWRTV